MELNTKIAHGSKKRESNIEASSEGKYTEGRDVTVQTLKEKGSSNRQTAGRNGE